MYNAIAAFEAASRTWCIEVDRLHIRTIKNKRRVINESRWALRIQAGRQVASRPCAMRPVNPPDSISTHIRGDRLLLKKSVAFPFVFFILDYVQHPCLEIATTIHPQISQQVRDLIAFSACVLEQKSPMILEPSSHFI